jgi:hypothetical protein
MRSQLYDLLTLHIAFIFAWLFQIHSYKLVTNLRGILTIIDAAEISFCILKAI